MILVLTQCFPPRLGGIEMLVGGLADAAHAAGRRVEVLADVDGGDAAAARAPRQAHDSARGYRVRRFGGWKPLRRRLKAWAAAGRLARAELVIADSWKSLELVRLPPAGARRARVHVLAHGMELPPAPSAAKAARIAAAFAKADRVIANSRYTADLARPYLGTTELRVATPPVTPQPEGDPRRLDGALAGLSGPIVATLGRLEARKGVDRLIEAVAALAPARPGLGLAVAGDGPDRPRLEALARGLGVGDRVRFLGRVDEPTKAALFARADLFAMPARREGASVEGFGIVYLEAAWAGLPALAGREGGAADAVIDGATGLLCDGADAADVTRALERLLADPVDRHRMAYLAKAHARAQAWPERLADFL